MNSGTPAERYSVGSRTTYRPSGQEKEVEFAYNDPSKPFYSFSFMARLSSRGPVYADNLSIGPK